MRQSSRAAQAVGSLLSTALAAAALVAGLGDCSGSGGSSSVTTPVATPTPTPVPTRLPSPSPSPAHSPTASPSPTATPTHSPTPTPKPSGSPSPAGVLYVVDANTRMLLKYALPLSASSTPVAQVSVPGTAGLFGVGADSAFVATLTTGGEVALWPTPLTSTSTASAQFTNTERKGTFPAFDPSGDVWTPTNDDTFDEFKPPFSNGMSPSFDTDNIDASYAITFDSSSNLYVTDADGGTVELFAPPYTGTPTFVHLSSGATPSGDAIIGSKLFVGDAAHNTIVVFTLPLSGSSTPAFSFAANHPLEIAADVSGKLYVCSNATGGGVLVFAPPFSASSTPILHFTNGLQIRRASRPAREHRALTALQAVGAPSACSAGMRSGSGGSPTVAAGASARGRPASSRVASSA